MVAWGTVAWGVVATLALVLVLWIMGPQKATKSVRGFAVWMLFMGTSIVFMREALFQDASLTIALVGAAVIGGLTYALLYQMDSRS